jgi:hypothetical protein
MVGIRGIFGDGGAVGGAGYEQVFRDVLQLTGSPEKAQAAVMQAKAALDDLFNQAVIKFGGDQASAQMAVAQHTTRVFRLATLLPAVQGENEVEAASALREATQILGVLGYNDRQAFNPWLRQHVTNDEVLRRAGFDPEVVRRPDSAWAHADVDALMALARDMLERHRLADGSPLSAAQIDGYLENARAAAARYGVGAARPPAPLDAPPPPGGATATGAAPAAAAAAPEGGEAAAAVTVQALNFPRRV